MLFFLFNLNGLVILFYTGFVSLLCHAPLCLLFSNTLDFILKHFSHLGVAPNLPTIPSASDFNTVLSSDQNTLDGTPSQHSMSQDDVAGVEEANQGFPAVQLADAQVSQPVPPVVKSS